MTEIYQNVSGSPWIETGGLKGLWYLWENKKSLKDESSGFVQLPQHKGCALGWCLLYEKRLQFRSALTWSLWARVALEGDPNVPLVWFWWAWLPADGFAHGYCGSRRHIVYSTRVGMGRALHLSRKNGITRLSSSGVIESSFQWENLYFHQSWQVKIKSF
jgi:hypothetical protein